MYKMKYFISLTAFFKAYSDTVTILPPICMYTVDEYARCSKCINLPFRSPLRFHYWDYIIIQPTHSKYTLIQVYTRSIYNDNCLRIPLFRGAERKDVYRIWPSCWKINSKRLMEKRWWSEKNSSAFVMVMFACCSEKQAKAKSNVISWLVVSLANCAVIALKVIYWTLSTVVMVGGGEDYDLPIEI